MKVKAALTELKSWWLTVCGKSGLITAPYLARLTSPLAKVRAQHATWSPYWRHFSLAVLIGILIEAGIHLAHETGPVKNIQNWVLDSTLLAFSQREKRDSATEKMPVIIAVDDIAFQSPEWGQDRTLGIAQINRLINAAFDRGATHVMVDFTLDDEVTNAAAKSQLDELAKRYGQLTAQGEIRHLYVARSTRPNACTPRRLDTDTLRRSVWDTLPAADPIGRPGLMIHPVLPHYIRDSDYVVRGWHLFGVTEHFSRQTPVMLPSPQLAYYAVLDITKNLKPVANSLAETLAELPWLASASSNAVAGPEPKEIERENFAHQQLQQVTALLTSQHLVKLCKDQPNAFGCSMGKSTAAHHKAWGEKSSFARNESINDSSLPLPSAAVCRSFIEATLKNRGEANIDHGRIYNRIVYAMSPWSEPQLPWVNLNPSAQWGYRVVTPATLSEPLKEQSWTGRFVAIGGAYASTGDWYQTPVGHAAGVFINVNAMHSMAKYGPISEPPAYAKWGFNLALIVLVAAIFAGMSPILAALTSAGILLGSLVMFHDTLLTNGMWIEFGAPLLGINIHRFIDDYRARRREITGRRFADEERLKTLGRVKMLEDRIKGSAWQTIEGGHEILPTQSASDVIAPNPS